MCHSLWDLKKHQRNRSLITPDCVTETCLTSSSNRRFPSSWPLLNTHSDTRAHTQTSSHALAVLITACLLSVRQLEWTSIKAPSGSMRYMSYWMAVGAVFCQLFLSACRLTSLSASPSASVSPQIKSQSIPDLVKGTNSSSSLLCFSCFIFMYLTSLAVVTVGRLCQNSRDTCASWECSYSCSRYHRVCVCDQVVNDDIVFPCDLIRNTLLLLVLW